MGSTATASPPGSGDTAALRDLSARRVRLDTIVEDPRNARQHDERNLEGIRRSLADFGQREPLVVRDGVVIGGNGRLRAMRALGWVECWVTDHDDLTEAQARALGVVLNRTAEVGTSWDAGQLELVVEEVKLECPDVELGFTDAELRVALRPEPGSAEEDGGAPDPLPESLTQRGDLIVLGGRHRVMCGDATSAEDVGALLAGETPGLMVTDPPYGVDYDASWRPSNRHTVTGKALEVTGGTVANDDRADWTEVWRLSPASVCYVWHGALHADVVRASLEVAGFTLRSQIIWKKPQAPLSRSHYGWQHEPAFYAVRGATADWQGPNNETTVWEIMGLGGWSRAHDRDGNAKQGHPTQKPLECMARPIRNHEHPEVYDPFLGSGTTLIAADQLDRTCYGLEIEPRYVDVIVRRWIAYRAKAGLEPDVQGWRGDAE